MQLTAKLKSKSTVWAASLKPRVLDVVLYSGAYYVNVTGINGAITDSTHWFPLGGGSDVSALVIDKTAADITGSDPNFKIDLSADGMPDFPASLAVYVDLPGDGSWLPVEDNYNPVSKLLQGMADPAEYPDQLIKIVVL